MPFEKPRRPVDTVFLHCSAHDGGWWGQGLLDEITRWHVLPKPRGNGWSAVGYHFLIDKSGRVMAGRSLERMPAAQYPHNPRTIAIMVHGLTDFPAAMMESCRDLCSEINVAYGGLVRFRGHREVNPHKTCPVFDYVALLQLDRFGRMK